MMLVITQIIVLVASTSGGLATSSEHISVKASDSELNDIATVNKDFKDAMKSLDDVNAELEEPLVDSEINEKKTAIVVPVKSTPVMAAPNHSEKLKTVTQKTIITKDIKTVQPNKKLNVLAVRPVTTNDVSSVEQIVTSTETMPDYIKFDNNGVSLADDTEKWSCVHDTATGLMWEVKSQNDALRNSNNLYSWYDPARKSLSGEADGGRCKGDTDCDTNAYIQAMNESNYCGHNDWRLPTREQMQTLVDLSKANDTVTINKQYFPNTMPSWYWTATGKENNSEYAWYVLFRNGIALSDLKERPKHIRLVRENNDSHSNNKNGG